MRKLRTGTMPPDGARRPERGSLRCVDRVARDGRSIAPAPPQPNPGRPLLHRLNRAEYANAIRDLLALDVDAASLLPPDDSAYGFDNVADVLGVSPSLQERYLSAAETISALAVGDPCDQRRSATPIASAQDLVAESARRRAAARHRRRHCASATSFRSTASTSSRSSCSAPTSATMRGLEYPHQFEITRRRPAGAPRDRSAATTTSHAASRSRPRPAMRSTRGCASALPVKAGPHTVAVAFVENLPVATRRGCSRFCAARPTRSTGPAGRTCDRSTITGPFNATGPGDTPSRRRIFVCRPRAATSDELALRAADPRRRWRGAPIASRSRDADLQADPRLLRRRAAARAASTPAFRARAAADSRQPEVRVPRRARSGRRRARRAAYRLSDLELASRLSFFLWSSIPDDELLAVARAGTAERAGGARAAGAAHAGRSEVATRWSPTSPASGCSCATSQTSLPELGRVSRFRRQPAAGVPARDRAVLRQHHAAKTATCSIC